MKSGVKSGTKAGVMAGKQQRRRRYGKLCVGGLGILLVLAWGAMRWTDIGPDHLLAMYLTGYIETVSDEWVEDELRQMTALEGPGLLVLLEVLDSPRPELARSARVVLDQRVAGWRDWPRSRASLQVSRLARGLAQRVDAWSPAARSVARDLAVQILDWPVDRRCVDRAALLADCERILRPSLTQARMASPPPLQNDATSVAPPSTQFDLADDSSRAPQDSGVMAAGGSGGLSEASTAELEPTDAVALASAGPGIAEPQLLPSESENRGVRRSVMDVADADAPVEMAPSAALVDGAAPPAMRTPSGPAPATDESQTGPPPGNLPPELALMYELNEPGARSARAQDLLRQRGFGETELAWARLLVSPQVAQRRQLREMASRMPHGGTTWLVWLSYDPEPEVRAAAVAQLVTSQAPHVARRLLELETRESDPDIRRQLQTWRTAELGSPDTGVANRAVRR